MRERLEAFAQSLLALGIEVVERSGVEISEKWESDPKVVVLALLCRSLGNMKGAFILAREGLFVEAQTLARCCIENLIYIGALRERGDELVEGLHSAHLASARKQAKLAIETLGDDHLRLDIIQSLKTFISHTNNNSAKPRQINIKEISNRNPVGAAYIKFSLLSDKAAHVSKLSLGRHLSRQREGDEVFLYIDIAPEPDAQKTNELLLEVVEVMFGVLVGTNEIVGGTVPGRKLPDMQEKLRDFRTTN